MKTKEEILEEHRDYCDHWADQDYSEHRVLQAMQIYSDQNVEQERQKVREVIDELEKDYKDVDDTDEYQRGAYRAAKIISDRLRSILPNQEVK